MQETAWDGTDEFHLVAQWNLMGDDVGVVPAGEENAFMHTRCASQAP